MEAKDNFHPKNTPIHAQKIQYYAELMTWKLNI